MPNLTLPGNPRYQPKDLIAFFGYDNLVSAYARVEIATLRALAECGVISPEDIALLTPEIEGRLLAITTSEVDTREHEVTKHDIRAWVQLAQALVDPKLARWIHVPLTSYDVIDTGRSLQYLWAYQHATQPAICKVVTILRELSLRHADTIQIGRTHGQAAIPITVGFWLATILNRLLEVATMLEHASQGLVGKISGPVGAGNALKGLGIEIGNRRRNTFEMVLLDLLNLRSTVCTQIVPPEPLANFLFQHLMLSAVFAQLGRDGRNLMRTEIGEINEEFEAGQVGSSTMAQKRNPMNFENLEGMYTRSVGEFLKVLMTMVSEHQRDLTGSAPARDFPIIVVNLHNQLNTLLRENSSGVAFLSRVRVNEKALQRNFNAVRGVILAEPLYLALQMAGYEGDAHHLVNHRLVPLAQDGTTLLEALATVEQEDEALASAWSAVPAQVKTLLAHPEEYTGYARETVVDVAESAQQYVSQYG